jgi:formylglycine-generating enzyme required for sulfatase activity
MAFTEHGIHFRYIPAGWFLMGSNHGEQDERPCHPVSLSAFWMSQTPISWATYCQCMDWEPPPVGCPKQPPESTGFDRVEIHLREANKIRLQYCEHRTLQAGDWHGHVPDQRWQSGGQSKTAQELFGHPPRDDPNAPWLYDAKPMVAVAWQEAEEMAQRLSSPAVRYSLPTEAQWEKAARGGLVGKPYAWGDAPPAPDRCDFNRFHEFSIRPTKTFPPNGYGLLAVNGGVWEWTRDWYDHDYYAASPIHDPPGPAQGKEKVLRGSSWADCADVLRVTYRMSRDSKSWREQAWSGHLTPNIGFRLCRMRIS